METPVSRNRRRSRLKGRQMNEDMCLTSTPSSTVLGRSRIFHEPEEDEEEEEDEDFLPCTQYGYGARRSGEVYWNYEASPATKEALRRKMNESDDPESLKPLPPPKPLTPTLLIRVKHKVEPVYDPEADKLLDSMRELYEQSLKEQQEAMRLKEEEEVVVEEMEPKVENVEKDAFSSDEDSFLVRCTQAVEEDSNAVKCQNTFKKPEEKQVEDDPFGDDDDGFDLLLSQMEIPNTTPAAAKYTKYTTTSMQSQQRPPPKPVATMTTFKRFKSTDCVSSSSSSGYSSSSSSSSSSCNWRRANSSPETPPGSLPGGRMKGLAIKPKCTREEIETKRKEALKRLQMKAKPKR